MKKILITLLCLVASQAIYARALYCPETVYYDGYKVIVNKLADEWDYFSYSASVKPGRYYFNYARAFRSGKQPAECGYTHNGEVIKVFGPAAKPGYGNWHPRTSDEWFCHGSYCAFNV